MVLNITISTCCCYFFSSQNSYLLTSSLTFDCDNCRDACHDRTPAATFFTGHDCYKTFHARVYLYMTVAYVQFFYFTNNN